MVVSTICRDSSTVPSRSSQLTLHDYRLYLGWERILEGGGGLFVEAGYVLGRELEYEVTPLTQSFNDAFLIRGGMSY